MCQSLENALIQAVTRSNASQKLRWSASKEHMRFPPIVKPEENFLKAVGEENLLRMVIHHHRLLQKSEIAYMYPIDEEAFMEGVHKAAHFFIQALGGGNVYTKAYGAPSMCKTHAPFAIDAHAREVWLRYYAQTLQEIAFPKAYLEQFWTWIETFSLRMINRAAPNTYAKRLFFHDVQKEYGW